MCVCVCAMQYLEFSVLAFLSSFSRSITMAFLSFWIITLPSFIKTLIYIAIIHQNINFLHSLPSTITMLDPNTPSSSLLSTSGQHLFYLLSALSPSTCASLHSSTTFQRWIVYTLLPPFNVLPILHHDVSISIFFISIFSSNKDAHL